MRKLQILFLVLGLVACVTSAANAQLIIGGSMNNGYFDETYPQLIVDNPEPESDFYLPKPTVWINEGTAAIAGPYEDELSSEPWAGPAPTPVTAGGSGLPGPDGCNGPDCGVFFKPFSGNEERGAATGHLYQDNPATPGLKYILTGWAGAEANAAMTGAEIAVELLDGGGSVIPASGQVVDLLPTLYDANDEPFNYKQYMAMAVAPANAAEVRARVSMIGATPNPAGGGQAFVVDDFTLTAVPEPATIAMVGLGVIGLWGVRRRSV